METLATPETAVRKAFVASAEKNMPSMRAGTPLQTTSDESGLSGSSQATITAVDPHQGRSDSAHLLVVTLPCTGWEAPVLPR